MTLVFPRRPRRPLDRLSRAAIPVVVLMVAQACNRPGAQPGPPPGPPPTAVGLLTLAEKPVERTSEFIATLRSLRSTTVQPDVEGLLTRIFVKSGDRVATGAPLVQIDPDRQIAAVNSTEANRSGAEADVQYWKQQVKRLEALVAAGAISRAEYDQAEASLKNAEAKLATLDAQVKEGRVQLQYYRVVSPQPGIVGDVPVREGDRVTKTTVITTITQNDTLEALIQVPIERAPELRMGLTIQLLDPQGQLVTSTPVSFVAPRVDESTQSVLVKGVLKDPPARLRSQQFAKARLIWSTVQGLTIPVVAVSRISGQYFCFVAESQSGGLVARQKPIQVGEVLVDDYILKGGLKAGDRVVVSGIQKIGDGAPIKAQ